MSDITIADVNEILAEMQIGCHTVNPHRCEFVIKVDNERLTFSSLFVTMIADRDTISVSMCPLGFGVKQASLLHTLKLCHLINNELRAGYFNVLDNESVGYVYNQFVDKETLTRELLEQIIEVSIFSWSIFAESIIPVMLGFSDKPTEAFLYCMKKFEQRFVEKHKNQDSSESNEEDEEFDDCE